MAKKNESLQLLINKVEAVKANGSISQEMRDIFDLMLNILGSHDHDIQEISDDLENLTNDFDSDVRDIINQAQISIEV